MTKRIGKVVVIEAEKDRRCTFCGAKEECRPYGPGGKDICFSCAMKPENKAEVERRFDDLLEGR